MKRKANQLILELLAKLGRDTGGGDVRWGDPEVTQAALIRYNGENNIVDDNHLFLVSTEKAMEDEWETKEKMNISDSRQQHP